MKKTHVRTPFPKGDQPVKSAPLSDIEVEVMLYGAACAKAADLAGMAKVEKHDGRKAQFWKGYFNAVGEKERVWTALRLKLQKR